MATYTQLDPDSSQIDALLTQSPVYIKTATVEAVQLTAEGLATNQYRHLDVHADDTGGYVVDIYVMSEANGTRTPQLEASQPVHPGDWIVANPVQQEGDRINHYGKTDDSFRSRYDATDTPGIYRAKGLARIAKNPTGCPISIIAYWGEEQFGDTDCYICAPVERDHLDDIGKGKRYILSANDFVTTYALFSPN